MHDRAPIVQPYLPEEIWIAIVSLVDAPTLKTLRLANKYLNRLASPDLFNILRFDLVENGCNILEQVASHPVLSLCVTVLVLERSVGPRHLGGFREWKSALDLPGCPQRSAPLSSTGDNDGDDVGLLSHSEWMDLPSETKRARYREYESDRKTHRNQVQKIIDGLQFRTQGCASTTLVHPDRFLATTANGLAVDILYRAFTRLPNIKVFSHQPGSVFNNNWDCRWRNLRFCRTAVQISSQAEDDEDFEALQLSVVLHALGHTATSHGLERISFCVGGPAFWGWERLRYLWHGKGCGMIRAAREEFGSAIEADRVEFEVLQQEQQEERHQLETYTRQLATMGSALSMLTQLDCIVSENGHSGALCIAADPLFKILRSATRLEKVKLAFGQLPKRSGGLQWPFEGNGPTTLLNLLAEHKPWPRLRDLALQASTDQGTLIRFLDAHERTLRVLTLVRIRLNGPREAEKSLNTWESTLNEIGKRFSLHTLSLCKLCDVLYKGEGRGFQMRVVMDSDHRIWRGKKLSYLAYHKALVERVLEKETVVFLEPVLSWGQQNAE